MQSTCRHNKNYMAHPNNNIPKSLTDCLYTVNSYSLEYSACPHFLIMRAALIKYKIENLIERLNFSFPTYFGEENKRKF